MATATPTLTALRIGPADHGRRLKLDEFIEAEFEEGWVYELARGVVEVTEVPGPWHGRIVDRLARMFIHYDEQHPGRINYRAGGAECRHRASGHGVGPAPGPGHLPRPGAIRPQGLDEMGTTSSSRSSALAASDANSSISTRSICGCACTITGSWTRGIDGCTPSSARATPGRRRLCPNPVSTTLCSSPACKSGPPSCSGPLRYCELQ